MSLTLGMQFLFHARPLQVIAGGSSKGGLMSDFNFPIQLSRCTVLFNSFQKIVFPDENCDIEFSYDNNLLFCLIVPICYCPQIQALFGSNLLAFFRLNQSIVPAKRDSNLSLSISGAHHLDLRAATAEDPEWLLEQRASEIKLIEDWLHDYYREKNLVFAS